MLVRALVYGSWLALSALQMVVRTFELMMVARVLQGLAGAAVWSLGLSLICDTVPVERAGFFLGFVVRRRILTVDEFHRERAQMIGFSTGALIGPLAGGILYHAAGWNAPFIFALCLAAVDIVARWAVIERREAVAFRTLYPSAPTSTNSTSTAETATPTSEATDKGIPSEEAKALEGTLTAAPAVVEPERRVIAPVGESLRACGRLFLNPRALTSFFAVALNGFLRASCAFDMHSYS